jgi:hypothetical protein
VISLVFTILTVLIIGGLYAYLYRAKDRKPVEELTIWLFFSVLLALAPLLFNAAFIYVMGQNPTLVQLLKNGELLLIAVAIGADAIGKLMASGSNLRLPKIAAGGLAILLVIFCSLLFASIATSSLGVSLDPVRVASLSALMFGLTVITSMSCTVLAEVEK